MVEISYPHTFCNVEDGELSLTKVAPDGWGDQSDVPTTTKFPIPGGNYHSIKGFLSVLNNIIPIPSSGGIHFGVLAKSHKITVTTGEASL